jgi:hypothetical protein
MIDNEDGTEQVFYGPYCNMSCFAPPRQWCVPRRRAVRVCARSGGRTGRPAG